MPVNIVDIRDNFQVFVFDIFGVLWDGKKAIQGSLEVLENLKKSGKTVVLLSNGTLCGTQTELSYAKRGFIKGVHYDKVVTSGDLAYKTFCEDTRHITYCNLWKPNRDLFKDSSYKQVKHPETADFVYIGVPQLLKFGEWKDSLTIKPFIPLLKKLQKMDKVLICANPDLYAFEKQLPEPVVRQGSIAQYYEKIGGKVGYFGKPYGGIYELALAEYDCPKEKMLMIGDTLRTDIAGGIEYGMKTALTLTGITTYEMEKSGGKDFEKFVEKSGVTPDYIITLS